MNIKIALENNFKVTKEPLLKMALDRITELEAQIEKMKCCENCKYKDLDYSFSPICISRGWDNIRGVGGNPLTFKCDEWEIKEYD